MNLRVLATFSLLLALSSSAAGAENDKTIGMKNGRFWNALTPVERVSFLAGIEEGWNLRGYTERVVMGKVILALHQCASPMTYGDQADMMTTAYKEPENRSLPIGWVMMADSAIQCGQTTNDAVFLALRKHLADISGKETFPEDDALPIDLILSFSTKKH